MPLYKFYLQEVEHDENGVQSVHSFLLEPPDTFTLLFLLGDLLIFVEDFVGFGFDTGQFDEHLKVFYIICIYIHERLIMLDWNEFLLKSPKYLNMKS